MNDDQPDRSQNVHTEQTRGESSGDRRRSWRSQQGEDNRGEESKDVASIRGRDDGDDLVSSAFDNQPRTLELPLCQQHSPDSLTPATGDQPTCTSDPSGLLTPSDSRLPTPNVDLFDTDQGDQPVPEITSVESPSPAALTIETSVLTTGSRRVPFPSVSRSLDRTLTPRTPEIDTQSERDQPISDVDSVVSTPPSVASVVVDTSTASRTRDRRRRRPTAQTIDTTNPMPDPTIRSSLDTEMCRNSSATPGSNGTERGIGTLPDPLDDLLGLDASSIPTDEPIVICLDVEVAPEYLGAVETLSRRLYRERVGGAPTALRISDIDELLDEDRWIEAADSVLTVALSDTEWQILETKHERAWERIWTNRIQNGLFAQGFGVVIFNRRTVATPGDHFPQIAQLSPSLPPDEVQRQIASLVAGVGDTDAASGCSERFGQRFNYCQEVVQREAWQAVEATRGHLFWDATDPDDESRLHRRLKTFAVRAFAQAARDDWSAIDSVEAVHDLVSTEESLGRGGDPIRADVFADALSRDGAIAVEAETLFGTGRSGSSPRDKLLATVGKYESVSRADYLVVLVDPLTVVTNGKTIASVASRVASMPNVPSTTFATIDFETGRLRSVASVVDRLASVIDESEGRWPVPVEAPEVVDS